MAADKEANEDANTSAHGEVSSSTSAHGEVSSSTSAHGEVSSSTSAHGEVMFISPRADFLGGLGWMALGVAVLAGSVMMDRLERQAINPYTIPGLLPGLLGLLLILLGGLMAVRSWARGALRPDAAPTPTAGMASHKRIAMAVALCVIYSAVLVGHGMPFWAASALFVFVTILVLQSEARRAAGEKLSARQLATTAVIALGAGIIITLTFQQLFLVRLP
jgi:hypothetical protein